MRKSLVSTLAVASLLMVGAAAAKTVAVTISKNGYVPKAATIAVGDTIQFTNSVVVVLEDPEPGIRDGFVGDA